jgi:hypothetical protein
LPLTLTTFDHRLAPWNLRSGPHCTAVNYVGHSRQEWRTYFFSPAL